MDISNVSRKRVPEYILVVVDIVWFTYESFFLYPYHLYANTVSFYAGHARRKKMIHNHDLYNLEKKERYD